MRGTAICLVVLALVPGAASTDVGGWSMDGPPDTIPGTPLTGSIYGRDLGEYEATFADHAITIRSKEKLDGWAHSEMIIFVGKDDRQETVKVTPASDGMLPHIHMKTAIEGRRFPGTLMYTEMYSMRLETRPAGEGRLDCAIHLSLPDYKKTHLVGRFTATKK